VSLKNVLQVSVIEECLLGECHWRLSYRSVSWKDVLQMSVIEEYPPMTVSWKDVLQVSVIEEYLPDDCHWRMSCRWVSSKNVLLVSIVEACRAGKDAEDWLYCSRTNKHFETQVYL